MTRRFVVVMTAVVFLLGGVVSVSAAERTLRPAAPQRQIPVSRQGKAADLTVQNASWSNPPKEGDTVGGSTILNILLANKGSAAAGDNDLKIMCTALSNARCPVAASGTINVPPLGPGASTMISWPSPSQEKWPAGRFRLDIQVDAHNRVGESNENNNAEKIIFAASPAPLTHKSGAKPTLAAGLQQKSLPSASVTAAPSPQLQPINIKINASKIRTEFPLHALSLFWAMDVIQEGTGIIPANTLEYQVSQTVNKGNPVIMTKGTIHQVLAVGQRFELKGDFQVCCGYNGMEVEIKDKVSGKVLAVVGAPLPVEPLRAKVQVSKANFRLTPKPAAPLITFSNTAAMPVKVKATLTRHPVNTTGGYVLADEREFWIGAHDSTTKNYSGKLGMFDTFRVKISQVCPVIMCPKTLCTEFPTYEGDFSDTQAN